MRFQSLIGLVVVTIGGVIFSPRRHGGILFLAPDNIANIVRAVSETGIIAIGMTFVIITAGIDLSVGALLSLSSVVTATMMIDRRLGAHSHDPVRRRRAAQRSAPCKASISTRFRLEPFIVTLAGLQAARGLALVISGNQYINISYGEGPGLAPPVFAVLGERLFNNVVPVATLVFVVVAVVAIFVLNSTRFGRYVFAVGGNERAARLSGVPVTMVKITVYAITGFASAIAGIVHAGQFNFGSANDGTGYELTAIAAVVIGGTSLFGGSGSWSARSPARSCSARSPTCCSSTTSCPRCSCSRPPRSSFWRPCFNLSFAAARDWGVETDDATRSSRRGSAVAGPAGAIRSQSGETLDPKTKEISCVC